MGKDKGEEEKERIKEMIKTGKINLYDIDKQEDEIWATADLYCQEKHLSLAIGFILKELEDIKEKLKKEPDNKQYKNLNEYYQKLLEMFMEFLNIIRIERAKHLKRIAKLKVMSAWCLYKHLIGSMLQFSEVGAKNIYMGNKEDAKVDFRTAVLCHDMILLMNSFEKKYKKDGKKLKEEK